MQTLAFYYKSVCDQFQNSIVSNALKIRKIVYSVDIDYYLLLLSQLGNEIHLLPVPIDQIIIRQPVIYEQIKINK